jgi:hypothetical protein
VALILIADSTGTTNLTSKRNVLSILITYTESSPGQSPVYSILITHDLTAAALQAAFIRKGDVVFHQLEAVGRAGIHTEILITLLTDIFMNFYMDFLIYIIFIYSQLILDA